MEVSRIVNSVSSSNTYALSHGGCPYIWLVDIGDVDEIVDLVAGRSLKGVFVTHSHYDHIYGLNEMVRRYPECRVYVSRYGLEGLYSDRLNMSLYAERPFIFEGENVSVLSDNDRVELFPGIWIEAYDVPGHDRSCMAYRAGKYLFTGDAYIPGVKVYAKFPNSNMEDAGRSVIRILNLAQEYSGTVICPGHNDMVCYGEGDGE